MKSLKLVIMIILIIGNLCDSCGEIMTASSLDDCKGLSLSSDEETLSTDTCCYYTISLSENTTGFCYGSIKGQESNIQSQIQNYFNEQGTNATVTINCNSNIIHIQFLLILLFTFILF